MAERFPMRVLVLGGSWFVGRAIVERAVHEGHAVTVFNRGRTPVTHPGGVQVIQGDREEAADLQRLAGSGPWDAVIDVAGAVPAVVRDAARALRTVADRYVFVSTVSAYRDWPDQPVGEGSPLHDGDPDAASVDPGVPGPVAYGRAKVGCEQAIAREFPPDRVLVVRPSVVLGPGEYVGRLPWWLDRMHRDGRVLAPGRPERPIQPIDVRDLASFLLSLLARDGSGVYNVASPHGRDTYGDLLAACAHAVGTAPEVTWVDETWLAHQDVRQWTEIPLWRTAPGTWATNVDHAHADGLTCRPLAETVADVWDWLSEGGTPVAHERSQEHGLSPDKEAALLQAWDARGPQ